MKIENLHEAHPGQFTGKELSSARYFKHRGGGQGALPEEEDEFEAPVETPEAGAEVEPSEVSPDEESPDLGVTGLDDLGGGGGGGGPMGGGPPEPEPGMDPGMGQGMEQPPAPVEQPEMYGNWSEVESFDRRDKTFEHPEGFRLRIRQLNASPTRYLAQLYKGKKVLDSGKVDTADNDPVEYIVDIAERALNLESEVIEPEMPEMPMAPEITPEPGEEDLELGPEEPELEIEPEIAPEM